MAYEPYDPPRDRGARTKVYRETRRDERDPRYVEEYTRVYPNSRDLVPSRRREDSELSVEEIRREFPPYGHGASRTRGSPRGYDDRSYDGEYDDRHRTRKGAVLYAEEEQRRKRVLSREQKIIAALAGAAIPVIAKEVWDRREAKQEGSAEVHRNYVATAALGAAGAVAGYQGAEFYERRQGKEEKTHHAAVYRTKDGRIGYMSDEEEEDPKHKKSSKSFLENALAAAGLGGAVKALTGHGGGDRDRDRDRDGARSHRGSRSRSRSRSRGGGGNETMQRIQKAAMASLIAGATEAFRISKEPGSWEGEKLKRVFTAATTAGALDSTHEPDNKSKLHLLESVIGGLVSTRALRGSKNDIEEDSHGRSRSRSRASSKGRRGTGIAALATAGLGALAGKRAIESARSRSRGRSESADSRGSGRPRSRSRSIVDKGRKALAKLGLGKDDESDDGSVSTRGGRGGSRRRSGKSTRDYDDDDDDDDYGRRGKRGDAYDDYRDRHRSGGGRDRASSVGSTRSTSSLGDSETDEKRLRKMRGKQLLTAGLATVATIHAAHNVYASMEKRKKRHKAVKEGRLSVDEAKKLKAKALMQDAASVGIAALGIQGAISELNEVREVSHEAHEWRTEKERRHARRLERLRQMRRVDGWVDRGEYGSGSGEGGQRGKRSRSEGWSSAAPRRPRRSDFDSDGDERDGGPPRYVDGNPYYSSRLPAPPLGPDYEGRR